MKAIILCLACSFCCASFGQKFAPNFSQWRTNFSWSGTGGPGMPFTSNNTILSTIIGDTIVGGDTLQIIHELNEELTPSYSFYECYYYLKLDSKRLYAGLHVDSLEIVYDFNLNIGDSFVQKVSYGVSYDEFDTLLVTSVDSVEIGGVLRKRITFNDFSAYIHDYDLFLNRIGMMWVEGIGDLHYGFALRPSTRYNLLSTWELNCFTEYSFPIYGDCAPASLNEETNLGLRVYPNPANQQITFDFKDALSTNATITIFSANGQLISNTKTLNTSQTTINLENWNTGFYFYQIQFENGLTEEGKFVVE